MCGEPDTVTIAAASARRAAPRTDPSRRATTAEPIDGAHVHLTLDQTLQLAAEKSLAEAVAQTQAAGAQAIVQLVKTGEILAMAATPDFDPERYREAPP